MTISREDVLHVAKLAKLRLLDDEVDRLMTDLSQVLEYVELLGEVPTDDVPAMSHVTVSETVLRDDVVAPVLSTEDALSEAPRRSEDGFAVPAFVDEG